MDSELTNGGPAQAQEHRVSLELSIEEAQALKAWLLQTGHDGASALDDEHIKPTLMQLGTALDYIEGVSTVRRELEASGFPTENLSDEQVAELGRRISDAPLRRGAASHA